uniref:Uncharacterized protein n=1 Tax=Phytophthora fragariae TaxID=53985 RepID=A0A6A3EKR6_9STRA|nr:hypothetical protein PF009_g16878 [Phytophthora fragariae]
MLSVSVYLVGRAAATFSCLSSSRETASVKRFIFAALVFSIAAVRFAPSC